MKMSYNYYEKKEIMAKDEEMEGRRMGAHRKQWERDEEIRRSITVRHDLMFLQVQDEGKCLRAIEAKDTFAFLHPDKIKKEEEKDKEFGKWMQKQSYSFQFGHQQGYKYG